MKINEIDDKLKAAGSAALNEAKAQINAPDKRLHFAGGVIVAIGAALLVLLGDWIGLWAACLAAGIAVGFGYELLQKRNGSGNQEIMDAVATASGAALVAALFALVNIMFF